MHPLFKRQGLHNIAGALQALDNQGDAGLQKQLDALYPGTKPSLPPLPSAPPPNRIRYRRQQQSPDYSVTRPAGKHGNTQPGLFSEPESADIAAGVASDRDKLPAND